MVSDKKEVIRQLFPVIIGSLIHMSFGMMLAWPTLAYPYLLNKENIRIPFILDETSPVLGFLMEGNALGALFANSAFASCKVGVCLSFFLQITGWVFMFYSKSTFWFFISRVSIGVANSYGLGQLKRYIQETCEIKMSRKIKTYLPLSFNVGIVVVIVLRATVNYRQLAFISGLIPTVGLAVFGSIPQRKKNVVKVNISNSKENTKAVNNGEILNLLHVIKDRKGRNYFALLIFLATIQQYSGGPQQIVYARLIYSSSGNHHVKLCAIIYSVCYLINMAISLKFAKKLNRKNNLLVSSLICSICLSLVAAYFHMKQLLQEQSLFFVWAPLILLIIYNIFHCFSFATLPLLLLTQHIPTQASEIVNKYYTIYYSLSAVVCTKIFRIISGRYGMAMGYLFFATVVIGGFIILLFISDYTTTKNMTGRRLDKKGEGNIEV